MQEIHLWAPDLDPARGGIQSFSYHLLRALKEIVPDIRIRTFSKTGSNTDPNHRHFGGVPSPLRTMVYAMALLAWGLRFRPTLVIATHVNFLPAARILKRLRDIPYVGVAHGIEVWCNHDQRLRAAMHHADLILAVSHFTRQRLITEQQLLPKLVDILPNTFDEDSFSPGPKPPELLHRYKLPATAKVIFSVGRLAASEQYKGFDRIISAMPEICRRLPAAYYLIGGTGDDRSRLESLAKLNGTADRVIFAGFIRKEELCEHYKLCDVFAMPSTGEGFGIVFLEALACGKPVLAGNCDGSTDALCGGRFGALIDPHNPAQLTDSIVQILRRHYDNRLMFQPEELRRQVVAEFGFTRFTTTLAGHLRKLLPAHLFADPYSPIIASKKL